MAYCTDNMALLAPNTPMLSGKEAVGGMLSSLFAVPGLRMSWTLATAQVAKSGELGYTRGTYQMTFNGTDGNPVEDHGKYLTVWRKEGGQWKVQLDMTNTDRPLAGQQ